MGPTSNGAEDQSQIADPDPQPLCHTGSRCGGSRRGVGWVSLCVFDCASLCLVDSATARLSATAQQAPLRLAHAGRSLLATSHLLLGFVLGPIRGPAAARDRPYH